MIEIKALEFGDQYGNTDFLEEYKSIRSEMVRKPITEKSMLELISRWKNFIFKLINMGLIDSFVGESLLEMFKATMVLN